MVRPVITTSTADLPEQTLHEARLRLLDIIGCMVGGARGEGSAAIADLARRGGPAESTVFDGGGSGPAGQAAMANAVLARSFDFGVLTPTAGGREVWSHISETTVPVALAVGERVGASLGDVLTALVLGDDAAARLSRASGFAPGQVWDSPGLINRIGATLVATRLTGLDETTTIHALGLIMQHMGGTFQGVLDGSLAFKLVQGLAARDAVTACDLAAAGWTAGTDPVLGALGYGEVFSAGVDLGLLFEEHGRTHLGDKIFKPYPGCRFTHAAIDAALELTGGDPVDPTTVGSVLIRVAPMHAVPLLDRDPRTASTRQVGALFSLQYQVANAVVRGRPHPGHFTPESVDDPRIADLLDRVTVRGDLDPALLTSAEVTLTTVDDTSRTAFRPTALGDPFHHPLGLDQITEKFLLNLAFAGCDPNAAHELSDRLLHAPLATPLGTLLGEHHAMYERSAGIIGS